MDSAFVCWFAVPSLLVLLTSCSPGLPIPAGKLEPKEELAWNQCREEVHARYNAFQRFFLEAPKAAFVQCMESHGYKLVEERKASAPERKGER